MKLKKLLFLSAALLGAGVASAAVTEREFPTASSFIDDVVFDDNGKTEWMYMYNTGAKKFFTAGNAWGTQTSIGDASAAYKVYFEKYTVDAADWTENTVLFYDSCVAKGAIKNVFFDTQDGWCYTDRGSQANYYWNLEKVGDSYRLSMSAFNSNYESWGMAGKYFGVNDTLEAGANTCVWSNLEPTEAHSVDWKFIPVAAFESNLAAKALYAQLQTAAEHGLDVAAQEAVYNNLASTVAELEAATSAVKKAIAQYEIMNVDPNNPVDKTSVLANPDYSEGKVSWTDTNSDWAVSYNVAEHYDDVFDHYQDLKDIPAGVWAVTVRGYIRTASASTAWDYYQKGTKDLAEVYAATATDTLTGALPNIWAGKTNELWADYPGSNSSQADGDNTWYVTNNMQGAEAFFNHETYGSCYDATVFFGVEADSVRVGLRLETLVGDDWVLWDNWRLTYYGGKPGAYQKWLDNFLANAPKYADDVVATAGTVEAYNGVVASYSTASTQAEVQAAVAAINEAADVVDANIAAWAAYNAAVAEGKIYANDVTLEGDAKWDLSDYVEMEAEDILAAMTMTTEEVVAETAELKELIQLVITTCVPAGTDVTAMYIKNADFESGRTDWLGNYTDVAGVSTNKCMEAYAITFDTYQMVEGAPVGIYEVALNGFFRNGANDAAYPAYVAAQQAGTTIACPVGVYVNNNKTALKNLYDEPVENGVLYSETEVYGPTPYVDPEGLYWYPNGMADAATAFAAGMYASSASGLVAQEGDVLRVGIKGEMSGSQWAIWDNFKMIYWGKQADKVQPHLEEAIATGEANLLEGMAKDIREQVQAAIENGKAVVGSDGNTMFDALAQLYASNDSVETSIALFQELETAAGNVYDVMEGSSASTDVKNEAALLAEEALAGVENSSITNAEARAYLEKIELAVAKLRIPDSTGASDATPIDFTSVIESADFGDVAGANTDEGWSYTTQGSTGNNDTQKSAFAYEYYHTAFDLYQELVALPAGTYTVSVDGFAFYGSDDYAAVKEGKASRTYLYAVTTDSTEYREVALPHISEGAVTEDPAYDGQTAYDTEDGQTLYWPGSMVSGKNWMTDLGYYTNNKVVITIEEGQTLRIGVKNATAEDWVLIDTWTLFYHGENSTADGIEETVAPSAAEVVKVEYYTINGVKVAQPQQGINIVKMTLSDGRVITRKTVKK